MLPPKISPSLKPLRNLLGRSNTGLSKAYGLHSYTNAAQHAASKSSGPLHAIQKKVGVIMDAIKSADTKADRELHAGGIEAGKQGYIYRKVIQKAHLNAQEKRATRSLLQAMTKDTTGKNGPSTAPAAIKAKTTHIWQQERRNQEMSKPKGPSSAAFYTYGDKVVKTQSGAGGPQHAGSAAELVDRSKTQAAPPPPPLESLGDDN